MEKLKRQRLGRKTPYRTSQLITMELEVRLCKFVLAVDISLLDNSNNLLRAVQSDSQHDASHQQSELR